MTIIIRICHVFVVLYSLLVILFFSIGLAYEPVLFSKVFRLLVNIVLMSIRQMFGG